jgi:hypothetical protein
MPLSFESVELIDLPVPFCLRLRELGDLAPRGSRGTATDRIHFFLSKSLYNRVFRVLSSIGQSLRVIHLLNSVFISLFQRNCVDGLSKINPRFIPRVFLGSYCMLSICKSSYFKVALKYRWQKKFRKSSFS